MQECTSNEAQYNKNHVKCAEHSIVRCIMMTIQNLLKSLGYADDII